jgi:sensor domain CHASE-containing protein/nitrogen-specific signal transduction histidine kinase
MSLRRKVIFTVVLLFIALFLILFLVSQSILSSGYVHLEMEAVQDNLDRAKAIVAVDQDRLEANVISWGAWDATYLYMQGKSPDYIEANLYPVAITEIGLDFAILIDLQNTIKFARVVDPQTDQVVEMPAGFAAALLAVTSRLLSTPDELSIRSGFVVYGETGIAVLALQPVVPSNRDQPAVGLMVMGRLIDESDRQAYSEALRLPVNLTRFDAVGLSSLSLESAKQIAAGQPDVIQSAELNYASAPLPGVEGQPVAMLEFAVPHRISEHGRSVMALFVVAFLVVAGVVSVGVMILLEVAVVHPIGKLLADVQKIQQSSDLKERVTVANRDELGLLAQNVNHMLDSLEQEHLRVVEMNARLVRLNELEELRAREGRFLEHASHEFRTPLTALNTRVYLLKKTPERLPDHVKALERTMEQMTTLVEEVFDVARISNYNLPTKLYPICLQDMLRQLKAVHEQSPDQPVVLAALMEQPVYVQADPTRLVQAFNKLISFLQNWSEGDKTCTISLKPMDSQHVVISVSSGKLRIRNLSNEDVLKPFAYASESGISNTGLNVVLAQAILLKHGGSLHLEMREGCTEFVVGLPLVADTPLELRERVQF